jgi:hypothetical protein
MLMSRKKARQLDNYDMFPDHVAVHEFGKIGNGFFPEQDAALRAEVERDRVNEKVEAILEECAEVYVDALDSLDTIDETIRAVLLKAANLWGI